MSIRLQILKAIDTAGKPLLANEIYNGCTDVETASQVMAGTYQAAHQGLLKAVKGEGGTRYELTDSGRALLAGEKTPAAGKARKVKTAKTRKVKSAKPAKKAKRKGVRRTKKPAIPPRVIAAARWAVTADGAFVDLVDPTVEISRSRARALVDFVRKLDAAEVAA